MGVSNPFSLNSKIQFSNIPSEKVANPASRKSPAGPLPSTTLRIKTNKQFFNDFRVASYELCATNELLVLHEFRHELRRVSSYSQSVASWIFRAGKIWIDLYFVLTSWKNEQQIIFRKWVAGWAEWINNELRVETYNLNKLLRVDHRIKSCFKV